MLGITTTRCGKTLDGVPSERLSGMARSLAAMPPSVDGPGEGFLEDFAEGQQWIDLRPPLDRPWFAPERPDADYLFRAGFHHVIMMGGQAPRLAAVGKVDFCGAPPRGR